MPMSSASGSAASSLSAAGSVARYRVGMPVAYRSVDDGRAIEPLLDADGIARLRDALRSARYTSEGIADRIGPRATAALRRNDFRAALRATTDRDPLATLIRLFVCAQTEPEPAVGAALPLPALLDAGLLQRGGDGIHATVDLEPYGEDWWVVADLTGGAVCADLGAVAPGLLTGGGTMEYVANWLHVAGEDWAERVAGWVAGTGLDAWIIQREVTDPVAYVQLWLADAGQAGDVRRTVDWLDWFDAHKVEAVGFGLVTLRRAGHEDPVVRVEDLRQAVDQPLGEQVAAWFDRQDAVRSGGLLDRKYRTAAGLRLHQEATIGPEGWAVDRQLLALPHGLRWSEEIDPLVLALVGGCDGAMALRDQLTVLAAAHDVTEEALAEVAEPIVAHLVERGFLEIIP